MQRYFHILILIALSCGLLLNCGKPTSKPSLSITRQMEPTYISLRNLSEEDAIITITQTISTTNKHPVELYHRCWKEEVNRKKLQFACLLAWAGAEDSSSTLQEVLHEEALKTREGAIAAVRNLLVLERFSSTDLEKSLRLMASDPTWIRALAVTTWIKTHPNQSQASLEKTIKAIAPHQVESPFDIAKQFEARKLAGDGFANELTNRYCAANIDGIAKIRCWRFISALDFSSIGASPLSNLGSYFPRMQETAWTLFSRCFPERFVKLRRHLQL